MREHPMGVKPSDRRKVPSDFARKQRDADTQPVGREKRIENMEIVVGDLENKFHQIFGHKIKTLGLVDGLSPEDRRKIIKVCVNNFSGFDREKGRVKKEIISPDRDPNPAKDPILSQVPETEWKLCERFLSDLNVAYIALDNLIKEDKMG